MTFRFLLLCIFSLLVIHEALAAPAELETLKQQFAEARSETVDQPISKKLLTLSQNYMNALDRAIQSAQSRGDIDSIVELEEEKVRVNSGASLEEPYSGEELKTLVSTFEKHRRAMLEEEVRKRHEMALKLNDSLAEMEVQMTRGNRIDDALAVREFRESDEFFDLIVGEGDSFNSSDVRIAIVAAFHPDSSNPGLGSSPALGTRVVIVAEDEEDEALPPLDTFQLIESADRRDIISVGKTTPPTLGMISENGSLIQYRSGPQEPIEIIANATTCSQYTALPLIGLNADGTLVCTDDADPELIQNLRAETNVAFVGTTYWGLALVKNDGTVKTHNASAKQGSLLALEQLTGVKEISFSGQDFALIVRKDGTAAIMTRGRILELGAIKGAVKAHAKTVVELESGEVISTGVLPGPVAMEAGEKPTQIYHENSRFAAIREDGSFLLMMSETGATNGAWSENEAIGEALSGAISFAWLFDGQKGWIIAVLPASSVPRSGIWKAEELIEARKKAQ